MASLKLESHPRPPRFPHRNPADTAWCSVHPPFMEPDDCTPRRDHGSWPTGRSRPRRQAGLEKVVGVLQEYQPVESPLLIPDAGRALPKDSVIEDRHDIRAIHRRLVLRQHRLPHLEGATKSCGGGPEPTVITDVESLRKAGSLSEAGRAGGLDWHGPIIGERN